SGSRRNGGDDGELPDRIERKKVKCVFDQSDSAEGGFWHQRGTQSAKDAGGGAFPGAARKACVEPISRLRWIRFGKTSRGPRCYIRQDAPRSVDADGGRSELPPGSLGRNRNFSGE